MNHAHKAASTQFGRVALLLTLSMLLASCGSSSNSTVSGTSGALSGNWQMTLQPSNTKYKTTAQSGFLLENNGSLSGSLMFNDIACSGVGPVVGTASGSNVAFTLSPSGISMEFSGNASTGSMSGDYTILSSGCSGTYSAPQMGTWTANLVAPLSGTIAGTFASNAGGTYTITGQLAQGANTGVSIAPLSGNLNASGYCFFSAAANMTGTISGTAFVLNLLNSEGTQIGWVDGTTNLSGNSVTGTYHMAGLGIGPGIVPPCVNGDSGTVTFTL